MKLPGTYMFIWPILKYVKKLKMIKTATLANAVSWNRDLI